MKPGKTFLKLTKRKNPAFKSKFHPLYPKTIFHMIGTGIYYFLNQNYRLTIFS